MLNIVVGHKKNPLAANTLIELLSDIVTCPQELVQFLSGSRDDRSRQRGCQLGHQDRFGCGWAIA